jgi:hypothetical protein
MDLDGMDIQWIGNQTQLAGKSPMSSDQKV